MEEEKQLRISTLAPIESKQSVKLATSSITPGEELIFTEGPRPVEETILEESEWTFKEGKIKKSKQYIQPIEEKVKPEPKIKNTKKQLTISRFTTAESEVKEKTQNISTR